jgi:hypothetical protein
VRYAKASLGGVPLNYGEGEFYEASNEDNRRQAREE